MKSVEQCVMLGLLYFTARTDWRTKQIPLIWPAMIVIFGFLFRWRMSSLQWTDILGGVLIGGGVLMWALISRGKIGMGDGVLFCATGIWLGIWENMVLLFFSSLCASVVGLFLMLRKKYTRNSILPFVPFVLGGYVCMILIT